MLEIRDLQHELGGSFALSAARVHLPDVRLQIGDRRYDARQDSLTIFHQDLELDLELRLSLPCPLDGDLAVGVEHQVLHVRAVRAVDRDAFSAGYIADDAFARK